MEKKCNYCGEKLNVDIRLVGNIGYYNWTHNGLHEDCSKLKNAKEFERLLEESDNCCCNWLQLEWYIFNY